MGKVDYKFGENREKTGEPGSRDSEDLRVLLAREDLSGGLLRRDELRSSTAAATFGRLRSRGVSRGTGNPVSRMLDVCVNRFTGFPASRLPGFPVFFRFSPNL